MENSAIAKEYISSNICTTTEASEFLGLTRQMITIYVNQGRLVPLKSTSSGAIFYKPDLVKLNEERYKERKLINEKTERQIYGYGNTGQSLESFDAMVTDKQSVTSVRLYFNETDAIEDGFYFAPDMCDATPTPVLGPTCVVKLNNGDELWFGGFNCGYNGTGPHGSMTILQQIGVDEDMAIQLQRAAVIEFFKECDSWDYQILKLRDLNTHDDSLLLHDMMSHYYLYNGNLVLAFHDYGRFVRAWDALPEQLLEVNHRFIPNPVAAEILSKEYAISSGHYMINFGSQTLFQVVLKDISGKEIWLPCRVDENVPVTRQDSIKDILRKCGINISLKQTIKEVLQHWLNIHPRIVHKRVFNK